jgi:integrase
MLNFDSALAIAAGKSEDSIENMRALFLLKYPTVMAALKLLDKEYTAPRSAKGYYLSKRVNKKRGFVYYVRYLDKGKLLSSKWCTYTNALWDAERFAIENRTRLVNAYKERKAAHIFDILTEYYSKDSTYMQLEFARNRVMGDHQRKNYLNVMVNSFVPFLELEQIRSLAEIDSALITRYQNHLLLNKKIKPQTANSYIYGINAVFVYLCGVGIIKGNPFNNVKSIPESGKDVKKPGCYHVDMLNGIFNRVWKDKRSYFLCLLMHTTNLRNNEIEKLKLKNIIKIDKYRFIQVTQSKTENGIRVVPLHDFVYKKILTFAAEKQIGPDDYIFSKNGKTLNSEYYKNAKYELGKQLKLDKEEVDRQNIQFYSGRHFWKTLMNAGELGDDIEEIFMGHSVSKDVAKSYNHLDKQGNKKMLSKTRRMFAILDEQLFRGKQRSVGAKRSMNR